MQNDSSKYLDKVNNAVQFAIVFKKDIYINYAKNLIKALDSIHLKKYYLQLLENSI